METMTMFPDFAPAAGLPRTPPYTPHARKRMMERAQSPAASVHPLETTSPDKKGQKREETLDNVKVEELKEGDKGYLTDAEVVYPEELEEADTASENALSSGSDLENAAHVNLLRRLSLLNCGDDSELRFERERLVRRQQRRAGKITIKRSHSQSIQSGAETTDPEVMDDHDLTSSQRRLRRRTRGPEYFAEHSPQASPCTTPVAATWNRHGHSLTPLCVTDTEEAERCGEHDSSDDAENEDNDDDDDDEDNDDNDSDNDSEDHRKRAFGPDNKPKGLVLQPKPQVKDEAMDLDLDLDDDDDDDDEDDDDDDNDEDDEEAGEEDEDL